MKTFPLRSLAVAAALIGSMTLASCSAGAGDEKLESALDDTRLIVDAAATPATEPDMPGLTDEDCDGGTRQATAWNAEIDPEQVAAIDRGTQDIFEAHGFTLTGESDGEKTYESGDTRVVTTTTPGADATFELTATTACH